MAKKQKNYRLDEKTIEQIDFIRENYIGDNSILSRLFPGGLTDTAVIELAVNYLYDELKKGAVKFE